MVDTASIPPFKTTARALAAIAFLLPALLFSLGIIAHLFLLIATQESLHLTMLLTYLIFGIVFWVVAWVVYP